MTVRRFTHWLPVALAAAVAGCAGSDRATSTPPAAVVSPVAQVLPAAAPPAATTAPAGTTAPLTAPAGTTATTSVTSAPTAVQAPVTTPATTSTPTATQAKIRSAPADSTPPPSPESPPPGPDEPVALRAPDGAPEAVRRAIRGANLISTWPYRYGGGHDSFSDHAYDCSGSVSYVLAWAGLLDRTLTSGQLAEWGEPGPGTWITVYANVHHTFMSIAGWRYDTSFRTGQRGSRWQRLPRSVEGFTVRHWPGL
jgi:hypothetical protein